MSTPPDNSPSPSRAPLDAAAVTVPAGWRLEVLDRTTSTNAEVTERFRGGARHGLVVVAEHQTAGRGRLGRGWVAAPGSSLSVSVLVEPDVAPQRWAWLPLLTGVAAARALPEGVARLKWPNDVLLQVDGAQGPEERKVGGILLERVEHDGRVAAVLGLGLNVHQAQDELPVPTATSLALAGVTTSRERLLGDLLAQLSSAYDAWAAGADVRPDYLALCTTTGRPVRVTVPGTDGEGIVEGEAVDVDAAGRLVVRTAQGDQPLGAGDVVHVRPQG